MIRRRSLVAVALLLPGSLSLVRCGSSVTPAAPVPVPTLAPTPTPTPAPPLSVIPPCALPASKPDTTSCGGPQRLGADVNAAVDRVITVRPDLFDFSGPNGSPKVKNVLAFEAAVVAALGEAGLCGDVGPEGEIGVKQANTWSEQWNIWASNNDVRRKYLYGCSPAIF